MRNLEGNLMRNYWVYFPEEEKTEERRNDNCVQILKTIMQRAKQNYQSCVSHTGQTRLMSYWPKITFIRTATVTELFKFECTSLFIKWVCLRHVLKFVGVDLNNICLIISLVMIFPLSFKDTLYVLYKFFQKTGQWI